MKILHLLDHSAPLHSGYTFRTLAILREQRRLGWHTTQLTSPRQGASGMTSDECEGFRFDRVSYRRSALDRVPGLGLLSEMLATGKQLAAVLEQEKPDIIHAHSPVLTAWPALACGRLRHLPVVYEVRAFWEDAAVDHGSTREGSTRYQVSRFLETQALRRVQAVTTICEGLRADIVARGVPAARVTVIPNAVDLERFPVLQGRDAALVAQHGLAGVPVLGFCGSFYGYEGLDLLLHALPGVLAGLPDTRLLLVGGGPQEAALKALADRLGLNQRVIFTGRVPHAQIERYYSLMDVLAFPRKPMRLTELVTPLKPLEAMAQGRVVVASDVGGHRELIDPGRTGLLFPAGDTAALARTLLAALQSPALRARLAADGRAFVEHERSWATSVARYQPVYASLMRGDWRAT